LDLFNSLTTGTNWNKGSLPGVREPPYPLEAHLL